MIVTLDDSGWPAKQLRRKNGVILTSLCTHNPIDHLLRRPCIQIHGLSKEDKEKARKISDLKHLYPLCHERNIVVILVHESVHCAAQNIEEEDDGLDSILGLIEKNRVLGVWGI